MMALAARERAAAAPTTLLKVQLEETAAQWDSLAVTAEIQDALAQSLVDDAPD